MVKLAEKNRKGDVNRDFDQLKVEMGIWYIQQKDAQGPLIGGGVGLKFSRIPTAHPKIVYFFVRNCMNAIISIKDK